MQTELDFLSAEKNQRLSAFGEFIESKKSDGYEVVRMIPRASFSVLKKSNDWIYTVRYKNDLRKILVSEWRSSDPHQVVTATRFGDHISYRRKWSLLKEYHIKI